MRVAVSRIAAALLLHLYGWNLPDPPGYRNTQPLPVAQILPATLGRKSLFPEFGWPFPKLLGPFPEFEPCFLNLGGRFLNLGGRFLNLGSCFLNLVTVS